MGEELDQFLNARIEVRADFLKQHLEPYEQEFETFIKDFEKYAKALVRAKKTGNYKPVVSKKLKVRESMKENSCPNTEIVKDQISRNNEVDAIKVKTEKLSIITSRVANVTSEEMPAPKMIPPKKRQVKREKESINVNSTRVRDNSVNERATRGRDNSLSERVTRGCDNSVSERVTRGRDNSVSERATRGRDNSVSEKAPRSQASDRTSDVVIENTPIPMIDLSDSEEGKTAAPLRSTRTRTIKIVNLEESNSTTVRSTRTRTKNKAALENETNGDDEAKRVVVSEDEADPSSISRSRDRIATVMKSEIEYPIETSRTTRTKTKAKPKRERSRSERGDTTTTTHKRSKSDPKAENEQILNTSGRTEYEDAVSDLEGRPGNSTFVFSNKPTTKAGQSKNERFLQGDANVTVVLERSNFAQVQSVNNVDDLLTDDDSIEEQQAVSPQKKKKAKEVFSPYDRSPVKKKVEAFEKFQKHEVLGSSSKANTSRMLKEIEENKGNVKEKAKGFTPLSTKSLYKNITPSTSKIGKYVGCKSTLNDSTSSFSRYTPTSHTKTASVDYREKEMKRQQREKEQKKQDMLKRAALEDRKRRHEEKLQQQKEATEREKQKALDAQRLKEEKHRLLLQQREEKHRQLKEEHEKKRLLAKQRADEKRKEEESLRMLAHQEKLKNEQMRRKAEAEELQKIGRPREVKDVPIYMRHPAPLLKCEDCYDSDDEDFSSKRRIPGWATKHKTLEMGQVQIGLGHRIMNTIFCCQNHSVDLKEIFEKIDPRKLKRSSSANWIRPPRFTMLPVCQEE